MAKDKAKTQQVAKSEPEERVVLGCAQFAPNEVILSPVEARCRFAFAKSPSSRVADIRKNIFTDGQLTNIVVMPLTPEEAQANPGAKVMLVSGGTILAAVADIVSSGDDPNRKVSANVIERVPFDVALMRAYNANVLADPLNALDLSLTLHNFLKQGKSKDEIRILMAPPGEAAMSETRYIQYERVMGLDDAVKEYYQRGFLTDDSFLELTNKAPSTIKTILDNAETRRVKNAYEAAVRTREYVERETDLSLKQALSKSLPPMPEYQPKRRTRKPKTEPVSRENPITATEIHQAEVDAGLAGGTTGKKAAPLTMGEFKDAVAVLKARGGTAETLATCIDKVLARELSADQFAEACVGILVKAASVELVHN